MLENSAEAERLAASQEGLKSIELVSLKIKALFIKKSSLLCSQELTSVCPEPY
jgi:hypothetical protein